MTNVFLPYINIIDIETLTEENQPEKIFVSIKFSTTLASVGKSIVNIGTYLMELKLVEIVLRVDLEDINDCTSIKRFGKIYKLFE